MFAQSMLTGSVGSSGWTPDGDITPLQINGRPAYRLLVTQPSSKGCGYVAGSNGYVFMMIGVAPRLIPWKFGQIQEALEKMKLSAPRSLGRPSMLRRITVFFCGIATNGGINGKTISRRKTLENEIKRANREIGLEAKL